MQVLCSRVVYSIGQCCRVSLTAVKVCCSRGWSCFASILVDFGQLCSFFANDLMVLSKQTQSPRGGRHHQLSPGLVAPAGNTQPPVLGGLVLGLKAAPFWRFPLEFDVVKLG